MHHAEVIARLAEEFDEDWAGYISGLYGVCLEEVVPEMKRKTELVESVTALLGDPRPKSVAWREQLREQVDELDAIERDFSPDYDRDDRFAQLPSRDRLIIAARQRYADVRTR